MDQGHKRIFDVISTALILGLGLNFFDAFKDFAKIGRWRILSGRYFELPEVILILGAESLTKVFQLMIRSSPKSLIFLLSLVWLLVNLGAQILVAVLPLSASLKSGYNSSGVTVSPGYVNVAKLDCFYRSKSSECDEQSQRGPGAATAHVYGEGGTLRDQRCSYQSLDDIHKAPQTCLYLARDDHREFAVRYADSNPTDVTNAYPYYGEQRIVTIAAEQCNGNLTALGPGTADYGDGPESDYVWVFQNSTGKYPISVPRPLLAFDSTTYIWNGTDLPTNSSWLPCGPRCVVLYALRDMQRGPDHEISIFQCHITISPVFNIKNPAHELSDGVARMAAASIALSGRIRRQPSAWRQFQLYQTGAAWAAKLDDSPEDIGARMAEFAASTLATMAQENPSTRVWGSLPTLGYQVDVEWIPIVAMTASIAAVHVLMMFLALWLAWPVIVVDDSTLLRVLLLKGLTMTAPPDGDELQLLPGMEVGKEPESTIRTERFGQLLGRNLRPGVQNMNMNGSGATLGNSTHESEDHYSMYAREEHALEVIDRGLPRTVVRDMI